MVADVPGELDVVADGVSIAVLPEGGLEGLEIAVGEVGIDLVAGVGAVA